MKRFRFFAAAVLFGVCLTLSAQDQPPPLYDVEEQLPEDLAIEKPAPKKKPKEPEVKKEELAPQKVEEVKAPAAEKTEKVKEEVKEEAGQKIQIEKEIALPSQTVQEPEVKAEEKKEPEIPVPADLAVIKPPEEAAGPATPDGGPLKDAGNDLLTGLPVTFTNYQSNFLSPKDLVDVFQVYTRPREGMGIILTPKHPSTLLVCDLLGQAGELLSQTQASAPGQTLSFQTSPFAEKGVLFLRIKDANLLPESPPSELREYSLELRPIAALPPPQPAPAVEELQEKKPAPGAEPKEMEKDKAPIWKSAFFRYGLGGFTILVLAIVGVGLIRRRKKQ